LQEKLQRNHESIVIIAKLHTWAEERLRAHDVGDKERLKRATASIQTEGEIFKKHCEMCKRQNILEHDPAERQPLLLAIEGRPLEEAMRRIAEYDQAYREGREWTKDL